ncbi:hypothetical protein ACFQYP_20440 [Nonomuraea antimicrobica]|uniref:hypothetical protein n=1 Tax=Nonomuraea antimicrobica TaxID=561173 RepID=UPI0031EFFE91
MSTTRQVLDVLCRVLGMDDAAHRHMLALAGFLPSAPLAAPAVVDGPTRALLESWAPTPATSPTTRGPQPSSPC